MATAHQKMEEMGFSTWKERRAYLEKHKSEILADYIQLGATAVQKKWHFGTHFLREIQSSVKQVPGHQKRVGKVPEHGVEGQVIAHPRPSFDDLLSSIPEDVDLEIWVGTAILNALLYQIEALKGVVNRHVKGIEVRDGKINELEEQITYWKDQHNKVVSEFNEKMARSKLGRVTLDKLREALRPH